MPDVQLNMFSFRKRFKFKIISLLWNTYKIVIFFKIHFMVFYSSIFYL